MAKDEVFGALANPVRRELLELLVDGPRTAGDLAAQFRLSRPAVAEHLATLRRAGLVVDRAEGRTRQYRLRAEPLAEVGEWLHPFEAYWRRTLGKLSDAMDAGLVAGDSRPSTTEPSTPRTRRKENR